MNTEMNYHNAESMEVCENACAISSAMLCQESKGCDSETQTDLSSKHTGTQTETSDCSQRWKGKKLAGLLIEDERTFLDLTGVEFATFEVLHKQMIDSKKFKVSKEDRLFIFLFQMRSGLGAIAIGVFFGLNKTTAADMFLDTLQHLVKVTKDCVVWPSKDSRSTGVPEIMKDLYDNIHFMIGFPELGMDGVDNVDDATFQLYWSQFEKSCTFKILIACNAMGIVCFKSKAVFGSVDNSELILKSGIIDLLDSGDNILMNVGYEEFCDVVSGSAKKLNVTTPPNLDSLECATKTIQEQCKIMDVNTYIHDSVAKLKEYKLLNNIPKTLFSSVDDIIQMGCVLVNLQPDIHKHKPED